MRGQEEILRERFSRNVCDSCGVTLRREDVMMLAHRASRWLVLVTCWRCQRRGIYIATFPHDEHSPSAQAFSLDAPCSPLTLSTTSGPQSTLTPKPSITPENPQNPPISLGDVDAMRRFLLNFNGDFRALFGGDAG